MVYQKNYVITTNKLLQVIKINYIRLLIKFASFARNKVLLLNGPLRYYSCGLFVLFGPV